MDAIHFKVREEYRIVSKAAYICMELDMQGYKDNLGIWVGEQEGAKFWLSVCNDLKNRGVKDIILACMDGLKGLPEAIKAVFPDVNIQNCIIHQIRNSIKYIASKDSKAFMKEMQNNIKVDCLDLGKYAAAKCGRNTGIDWNEVVDNADIDVNVKVKIDNTGKGNY